MPDSPGTSERQKRTSTPHDNLIPKKKRKQRRTFACAECRRLKMRCDRQVPCANCVRRRCSSICPNGGQAQDELRLQSEVSDDHPVSPDVEDSGQRASGQTPPHPNQSSPVAPALPTLSISAGNVSSAQEVATSAHGQHPAAIESEYTLAFVDTTSWSSTSPVQSQQQPNHEEILSSGTLLMAKGGRSKYLGPNASSEWLRDQEAKDPDDVRAQSRMASPTAGQSIALDVPHPTFPFATTAPTTTEYLTSKLPPMEEGRGFADAYFRYFAWQYDVVPRRYFQPMFDRIYAVDPNRDTISPQELALVYMVFAMGVLYSLELPPNDPAATEYLMLSKSCLVKGNFLVNTTLSGVQTLHIMAHFHLETEEGRNGDSAWPLWGLAMRISQAMGLHRDGESWGLPPDVIEERRHVFWECNAADIFQANNFCRPCSISPDYVDTKFPQEPSSLAEGGRGYFTIKWELAVLCGQVLDLTMKIRTPPYTNVLDLNHKLSEFERSIPYPLRCRSALLALPSMYTDSESAIRDSPDVRRRDIHRVLHQCTLAVNVSEAFLFLHRPYFVKALREQNEDLTKSAYAQSFFSVVERCNVMIVVAATIHSLFPAIAVRHWFFWHHAFNSAVTMGTLIIRNPQNTLAPFALTLIDSAILLLTRVIPSWPSPRMAKNLKWLNRLRNRAASKLSTLTPNPPPTTGHDNSGATSDDEDVELIGWCTRLVERAATGSQTVRTILSKSAPSPNVFSSPSGDINSILDAVLGNNPARDQSLSLTLPSPSQTDPSTDVLLHQFWDPMLMMVPSDNLGLAPHLNATWWDLGPSSAQPPGST